MVSNASEDLPEPDRPVMTTSESRGSSTVMSLRLCSRAPLTTSFATDTSLGGRTDVPLAPEEHARGIYGDIPPQLAQTALQPAGFVRDLDDVVRAAVVQPAADALALDQLVRRAIAVVDEHHAAVRRQRVRDHRPERLEALARHVGEPEAEEDRGVAAIRPPLEQICADEPHPGIAGDP